MARLANSASAWHIYKGCWKDCGSPSPNGAPKKLYVRASSGVFFLDLAESSPFIETNGREEVVGFLQHYDASNRTGPLFSLTFGGEYETFGQNLFTEARGFFTSHSTMDVNEYDRRSESWDSVRRNTIGSDDVESLTPKELEELVGTEVLKHPDIRFAGWVGSIDGEAFDATPPNFAWGDPIHIRTQRQVKFLGGDFVTGVSFGREGRRRTSLFIGPSYKRLTQEAGISPLVANSGFTTLILNMKGSKKLSCRRKIRIIRWPRPSI